MKSRMQSQSFANKFFLLISDELKAEAPNFKAVKEFLKYNKNNKNNKKKIIKKTQSDLTSPPSSAPMKAQVSLVQERTVSVLPSLKRRVMDDS